MPATQSQNLTTLAFMTRSNQLYPFTCQGAATSEVVASCFEEFVQTIRKKTVVVPDNAPPITAKALSVSVKNGKRRDFSFSSFRLIVPN